MSSSRPKIAQPRPRLPILAPVETLEGEAKQEEPELRLSQPESEQSSRGSRKRSSSSADRTEGRGKRRRTDSREASGSHTYTERIPEAPSIAVGSSLDAWNATARVPGLFNVGANPYRYGFNSQNTERAIREPPNTLAPNLGRPTYANIPLAQQHARFLHTQGRQPAPVNVWTHADPPYGTMYPWEGAYGAGARGFPRAVHIGADSALRSAMHVRTEGYYGVPFQRQPPSMDRGHLAEPSRYNAFPQEQLYRAMAGDIQQAGPSRIAGGHDAMTEAYPSNWMPQDPRVMYADYMASLVPSHEAEPPPVTSRVSGGGSPGFAVKSEEEDERVAVEQDQPHASSSSAIYAPPPSPPDEAIDIEHQKEEDDIQTLFALSPEPYVAEEPPDEWSLPDVGTVDVGAPGDEGWEPFIGIDNHDCWIGVWGEDGYIYQTVPPTPCLGRCPYHSSLNGGH
ncbi:hypothetical protein C2E23DRAFT_455586 [Lenzites betulinus]|nr:hypothetical protein C2E23DRAFT_455586 [Lenzites betulinus]